MASRSLPPKLIHELRDPVHGFVKYYDDERRVLDSRAVQRLRQIHQLSLTYLVYASATHRRFEHSLGVMELADCIYQVVTRVDLVSDEIRRVLPVLMDNLKLEYWRRVLRVAALCHDVGHLPFSHVSEELLPEGTTHESLTRAVIESREMASVWAGMVPRLDPEHIVKLALGPKEAPDLDFSTWETLLSEVIVGDAFGADRMDYLLRDSLHCGVKYGLFDHLRLIDCLRILPPPRAGSGGGEDDSSEPTLGVVHGGLHSAEQLLLARYFIYSQVYYHPIRRIYDRHMVDFLKGWLPRGTYPTTVRGHLALTDNEVMAAMIRAARSANAKGHDAARRITERKHFKEFYRRNSEDDRVNIEAADLIFTAAVAQFGEANVRRSSRKARVGVNQDFPVLTNRGDIASAFSLSETLQRIPDEGFTYLYIDPDKRSEAFRWLEENKEGILKTESPEEGEGGVSEDGKN